MLAEALDFLLADGAANTAVDGHRFALIGPMGCWMPWARNLPRLADPAAA